MERERTLVLLKPDAVRRRLIGELIKRIEQKNLDIVALKMIRIDKSLAEEHYAEHRGKPFFPELIEFITSGNLIHGSDSKETAAREIERFFAPDELVA